MPNDLDPWKQWEGQSVDSVYPLEHSIGGSSHAAVFETQFEGRPAAIKIVSGTQESIDALLAFWEKAASLSHPALVPIFAYGETVVEGTRCAYIVMERADENLAEVLAGRFLTSAETRDMLLPVLGALQHLDAKGFAHGRLKPANIMAFGEQVKISTDSLVAGGDAAADCRAIGVLIEEVLGDTNAKLPKPFAEIAKNCLTPDPAARWNRPQIEAALSGNPPAAARAMPRAVWWGLAAVAAVLALFVIWHSQNNVSKQSAAAPGSQANVTPVTNAAAIPAPAEPKTPETTPPEAAPAPKAESKPKPSKAKETFVSPPTGSAKLSIEQHPASDDGITRVMPNIPLAALNTITGRVRINVRVHVDGDGSVSQATLEPPGASKYFTDRVLAATQSWKFPAESAPQDWELHFELIREQVRASAVKITK